MEFLKRMAEAAALLPDWAPRGAAVVELPDTPFGSLRVAVIPVDPGERAARKARGLQAMAPGLRAMARLRERGEAAAASGETEQTLALLSGALDGMMKSLQQRTRDNYALATWLLTEGVIGLASPDGEGGWTWAHCRPVMDRAKEVIPAPDAADEVIRPWVSLFWRLGDDAAGCITERIDLLTGVV